MDISFIFWRTFGLFSLFWLIQIELLWTYTGFCVNLSFQFSGRNSQSVQFSSVTQSCPTLCDPMDCSMPGHPVPSATPGFIQYLVHWVGDVIQQPHPLSSTSPPTFSLSQHQGFFQWVSSSHQVAKVLEFHL